MPGESQWPKCLTLMNSVLTVWRKFNLFLLKFNQISVDFDEELHACSEKTPCWPDISLWFTRRTASGSSKGDESLWKRLWTICSVCLCGYRSYSTTVIGLLWALNPQRTSFQHLLRGCIFISALVEAESSCSIALLLFWNLKMKRLIFQQKSNAGSQCETSCSVMCYFDWNWYLIMLDAIKINILFRLSTVYNKLEQMHVHKCIKHTFVRIQFCYTLALCLLLPACACGSFCVKNEMFANQNRRKEGVKDYRETGMMSGCMKMWRICTIRSRGCLGTYLSPWLACGWVFPPFSSRGTKFYHYYFEVKRAGLRK